MKKIIYIAHRGLHNSVIPENSISSIKNALTKNKNVEIDIQLTKDDKLIVFHDKSLLRLTGINKDVFNTSYEEINKLYLNNTLEKVPLFKNILNIVQGKIILDIEIKSYKKWIKTVFIAHKTLKDYKGIYFIKSFNPLIPWLYKKLNPNISCGVLVGNYPKNMPKFLKKILQRLKYLGLYKPDFICYNINEITQEIVKKIKEKDIPLYIYTIKNEKDLKIAQKIGKGIIYENLDL